VNLDRLPELLNPLNIGNVYNNGNYAYYERFSPEVLVVTKKNTQKTERKGLRFSKAEQMHKIVAALTINIWFFGKVCLIQ
jgi:hypothetical protein